MIQLSGGDLSARRALATHLAARSRLSVFSIPAVSIPIHFVELEALHRLWEREAILQNAALLLECDRLETADAAREMAIDRWIELSRMPLLISTREPRRNLERMAVTADIGKPTSGEQRAVWERELGVAAADLNGQLERVISQFDFSTATIRTAAGRVLGCAVPAEELCGSLWDACRLHARPKLDDLAQRIPSSATWADLVLPPPQMETLRNIAIQVRHRAKVCDEWGFGEQSSRGLGLSALFCGPSGTGKTLAAEILANEMRLDLFRIDLSAVVSKYIGETEKNLRRVFEAAEEGGAVLLFDEADALFGKRSEVKDSHDRYANVEVSYLLQRMEAYRGLAILTTNMKESLDPAFLRRLRFRRDIPVSRPVAPRRNLAPHLSPEDTDRWPRSPRALPPLDRRRQHPQHRPQRRLRRRGCRRTGADESPLARHSRRIRKARKAAHRRGNRRLEMNPRQIDVHIEELVLHGFAHGDRWDVADAIERELRDAARRCKASRKPGSPAPIESTPAP